MFITKVCDLDGGCRLFGPFSNNFAAHDWALEAQNIGLFPEAVCTVHESEEPFDLLS